MHIESLVRDYLAYCEYQKNLAQDTLKAYCIDMAQFSAFMASTPKMGELLTPENTQLSANYRFNAPVFVFVKLN